MNTKHSRILNFISSLILRHRENLKVLFMIAATVVGYFLALGVRFDFDPIEILSNERVTIPLSYLLLLRLSVYRYFKLHSEYWRFSSTRELKKILIAHTFSSIIFTALLMITRVPEFPRSVVLIEYCFSILIAGGSRLFTRIVCEELFTNAEIPENDNQKQMVILGGGKSGHILVKLLQSNRALGYKPVCVLDDDDILNGLYVHGVKVVGRTIDLPHFLKMHPQVSVVVIAIPSISKTRIAEIEQICRAHRVSLKRLQSFENMALQDAISKDGPQSIESILDRETHVQHEQEIREQLHGKTVLVTGGGGSIGSEIIRQILPYRPAKIIIFDSSEYNLFKAEQEFSGMFSEVGKRFVIGNISDRMRINRIFQEESPQIVFHAAAYKHVPIMEFNCSQAFVNNVIGTWCVLEAAATHNANRFILISTDKAVDPSSVMGCSKRLAEWVVQQFTSDHTDTSFSTAAVRFGNVINSAGSVIPLFRDQILSGGPVTVTHPDIERFFMSIQEAVRLVLTAGTLGERGEVYVLDMGQKIKIVDVAKKMLSLLGREDIPIVFTGLRPGEKITEYLVGRFEDLEMTTFSKVNRLKSNLSSPKIFKLISDLEQRLPSLSDKEIGEQMHQLVSNILDEHSQKKVQYAI